MTRRRRGSRLALTALVALAAAGAAGLLPGSPAYAHATLVSSTPSDGSTLSSSPRVVRLRFDEPVASPAYVVVTAPDGSRVEEGPTHAVDNTVTQRLVPLTQRGQYTVSYRVVSVDGHPVTGQLRFTLTSGTGEASPSAAATSPTDSAEHAHSTGLSAHWEHVIPLVGVTVGWLVVTLTNRRRRSDSAGRLTPRRRQ